MKKKKVKCEYTSVGDTVRVRRQPGDLFSTKPCNAFIFELVSAWTNKLDRGGWPYFVFVMERRRKAKQQNKLLEGKKAQIR